MLQHSYDMPAKAVQYSICDNLLLVFNEAGAVHIIDVDTTASTAVSGPQAFHVAQPGVRLHSGCYSSSHGLAMQLDKFRFHTNVLQQCGGVIETSKPMGCVSAGERAACQLSAQRGIAASPS